MAETYAQRKASIKRQLRQVKKVVNTVNTGLEIVRRELDRLIDRKTLIGPETLTLLLSKWQNTLSAVNGVAAVLQVVIRLAETFL